MGNATEERRRGYSDETARAPEQRRLVNSEYIDFRFLYAAMHVFERMGTHRERFALTKDGWRLYRSALGMIHRAADELIETVPDGDRKRLRADLNNSDIYMHTTRVTEIKVDDSDMIFMTRNQMKDVVGYALQGCELCDKEGRDVAKCKKRKAIHGLFTHELPVYNGDHCLWNDFNVEGEDGRMLMKQMTWAEADRQKEMAEDGGK